MCDRSREFHLQPLAAVFRPATWTVRADPDPDFPPTPHAPHGTAFHQILEILVLPRQLLAQRKRAFRLFRHWANRRCLPCLRSQRKFPLENRHRPVHPFHQLIVAVRRDHRVGLVAQARHQKPEFPSFRQWRRQQEKRIAIHRHHLPLLQRLTRFKIVRENLLPARLRQIPLPRRRLVADPDHPHLPLPQRSDAIAREIISNQHRLARPQIGIAQFETRLIFRRHPADDQIHIALFTDQRAARREFEKRFG